MSSVFYRNCIRIAVGEISRAGELAVRKDMSNFFTPELDREAPDFVSRFNRYAEYMLAQRATRSIAIRTTPDSEWHIVEPGEAVSVEISEGEFYTFKLPMTEAEFDALPTSLTRTWLAAAITDNERLGGEDYLNYFFPTLKSATSPDETELEHAQLPAPSTPDSPPTPMTGTSEVQETKTTRRKSSDGS